MAITTYLKHLVSLLLSIPKVRGLIGLINLKKTIQTLGNMIFATFILCMYSFIVSQLRKKCSSLVVSVGGSDFYRSSA